MKSIRRRIVEAVAILTGCGMAVVATPVSAQSPQPAFYTYQAPGGASTYTKRVIALTFDDGPGAYTPQVLSVLEKYHVPATFFEIGENVVQYPQYTRMLAAAGYPVEDHTWTHPDLSLIPVSDFPYEIDQTQNEIRSLTGVTPTCVRPPYDDWDTTVLDQIAERGLTTMSYSINAPATGRFPVSRPSSTTSSAQRFRALWSTCTTEAETARRPSPHFRRSSRISEPRDMRSFPSAAR